MMTVAPMTAALDLPFAVRMALAFDTLWWGGVLALPGAAFARAPGLRSMAEVLPEDVWAALFVLGGLLCLARPWLRWRRVRLLPWMGIAFLEGVVALSMSIAALRGEVAGLNIGAHLVLVALSYVCLMREAALIRDVAPAP